MMSSVSPDGKWVVYVSTQDTMGPAWRVPLAGGPPEKIVDGPTSWLRVSPDSRFIACGYSEGGVIKLAIVPIEGGQPLKTLDLPSSANLRFALRWTPDGQNISYRDWQSGYWVQSIAGGEPRKLDDMPEEKLFASSWSKDGKLFAFSRGQEIRDVILLQDPAAP
jgi:Tol biopolymer transport system component